MNEENRQVYPVGTEFEDGGMIKNVAYYKMSDKLTAVRYIFNDNKTIYWVYPNNKDRAFSMDEEKIPDDLIWHATNKSAQEAILLYSTSFDEDDVEEEE
jgi:hypothetical protein